MQGDVDKTTTEKEAREYLACLRHGQLKMISGGHFAFMESAMQFNLLAEEFLNG